MESERNLSKAVLSIFLEFIDLMSYNTIYFMGRCYDHTTSNKNHRAGLLGWRN